LQLIDNPAKREFELRESKLKALKLENQQLLDRLAALSTSDSAQVNVSTTQPLGSDTDTLVPRQCLLNVQQELAQLEEQLAMKEKRMQRLKEVGYYLG
jgi:hypothetical protein